MGTWNYLWHYIFLLYLCAEATTTSGEGTSETPTTAQDITTGPNNTVPDTGSATTGASSAATSHSFVSHTWTPGILSTGSGAMVAQAMTSSPALTMTITEPWNSDTSMSPDSETTSSPALTVTSPGPWNSDTSMSPDSETTSSPALTMTSTKPWNSDTSMSPDSETTSSPALTVTSPGPWNSDTSMSPDSETTSSPALTVTSPGPWNSDASMSPDSETTSSPALTVTSPGPWNSDTSMSPDSETTSSPAVASSITSSTPGITSIGSGAVTAETMTFSPAPSSHIMKVSVSTAETQTALLTSRPFTQGQVTVEAGSISSSTSALLPAVSTASAASRVTTRPDEGKSAITDQGSSTTAEPKASTSLSLAATSLVTEFMTNFRKSTSVDPSLTCLPVSIEVQNVTGNAIQLSWTGGGRDSLYTISLLYGNQQINVTETHETEMMFENLLPSRVYKISVAASSCAESSVRVRTDSASCSSRIQFCSLLNTGCDDFKSLVCSYYQAFACSVWFKNWTFNNALYNSESGDYKAVSDIIEKEVVKEMRVKLHDDHFDIIVLGFKPGSVIAGLISVLQNQELVDVNIIQRQLNEVLKSKFVGSVDTTVQSLSIQSSTETYSSWKVAVIVLGVLLGVALVLLLLVTSVCTYMKKRSGKYVVEPKGLLENVAYKHL